MLSIENLKPLLETLGLRLAYSKELYDNESLSCMSLYTGDRLLGTCFFEDEGAHKSHIRRIDIDTEHDRKKGYGSILMYATLSYIDAHGGIECDLTGFAINFSFYAKNGFFCYNTPDGIDWYSLSLEEKKEMLYKEEGHNQDRSTFFADGDEHLDFIFNFKNTHAINRANQNINELIADYKDELSFYEAAKSILNLYKANSAERTEAKIYLQSRYMFLKQFPNNDGKALFEESLKNLHPTNYR